MGAGTTQTFPLVAAVACMLAYAAHLVQCAQAFFVWDAKQTCAYHERMNDKIVMAIDAAERQLRKGPCANPVAYAAAAYTKWLDPFVGVLGLHGDLYPHYRFFSECFSAAMQAREITHSIYSSCFFCDRWTQYCSASRTIW